MSSSILPPSFELDLEIYHNGRNAYWKQLLMLVLLWSYHLQQYYKIRSQAVQALKAGTESPYPHKFHVSTSLAEFIEKYKDVADGTWTEDVVTVSG